MKKIGLLVVALSVLTIVGCAGTAKTEKPAVEDMSTGAETRPATDKGATEAQALAARQAELLAKTRVHFAFDSSTIDDEARAIIEAHASYLAANPGTRLTLEGHCDERGTREYNLALGERRAQAVEKLMRVLGVDGKRITTVSFGEEKPVDSEHNESAWRQNRRAEILYKK
ncbi:MAG: peptidoglycan-associated lipoprotein Pal [Gammaproteobacteria bacterium]|nr:MAG: peptidoglycan-associated lipoprotein Pal [Gammaproteobacteria bacterium]